MSEEISSQDVSFEIEIEVEGRRSVIFFNKRYMESRDHTFYDARYYALTEKGTLDGGTASTLYLNEEQFKWFSKYAKEFPYFKYWASPPLEEEHKDLSRPPMTAYLSLFGHVAILILAMVIYPSYPAIGFGLVGASIASYLINR